MPTCRQIWEDIYGIEILTGSGVTDLASAIAAGAKFDDSAYDSHGVVSDGSASNIFNLLPVDDYPAIKAPLQQVEKQLATGVSIDNTASITTVSATPEPITVPVIWNAHNIAFFSKLFFQNGISVGDGTTNTALEIMTAIPYTDACPVVFGNATRVRQDGGDGLAVDELLKGMICTRMVFRGEEGGLLEGEVELMGAAWSQVDLTAAQVTDITPFDGLAPLKFEDCTVKMQNSASPTTMDTLNVPTFEFTLMNNSVGHFYNATALSSLTLGRFKVEGTMDIPWNDISAQGSKKQIVDFAAGSDKVVSVVFGNASFNAVDGSPTFGADTLTDKNSVSTDNYFGLHMNMRITDYDSTDLDELPITNVNLRMVKDSADTIGTFKAVMGYLKATNSYQ